MNTQKLIPIFFAVDDTYSPYLAVALQSLKATASDKNIYEINILIDKISDENRKKLSSFAGENIKISFCDVSEKLRTLCSKLHLRDYYTKATYYRFFIPEMFPQYNKGVYLDCDIAITRDIADMFNTPMGRNLVCAVNDEVITDTEIFANYSEIVLDIPRNKYFNAGILVMNLAEMRRIHIERVFADMLSERTYPVAQDQDYLNIICHGRVKYLNLLWNKTPMPYSDKNAIPYIVHYKINFKPWRYDDVIYGDIFWKHAVNTPYYEALLNEKNNCTEDDVRRDAAQYASLEALAEKEIYNELCSQSPIFGDAFFPIDFNIDSDELFGAEPCIKALEAV